MSDPLHPMHTCLPISAKSALGPAYPCAHLFWIYPMASAGPYLLVIDIGQDASNDLQQEDDEEQDEVLGSRDPVNWGSIVPEHHKASPNPRDQAGGTQLATGWGHLDSDTSLDLVYALSWSS